MRMRFSTSSIVCFSPYPAELTFPSNLNYIDIDNESLVTWLHHVTSHFFLPPAPVKFPVKFPVQEMPKSPAVAQGCQSMTLDETTAGEK